jgi:hypothetical protein
VIVEKFHAMVDLGLRNTRMKDFYDVWKLSQQFEFDGEIMVEAIRATFSRRQTPLPPGVPLALSDKFASDPLKKSQWAAFLRKSALKDQEKSLGEVVNLLERFLLPVLGVAQTGDHFPRRWVLGGSWEAATTISSSENKAHD